MFEQSLRAELLVPRDKVWWTFLALSAGFPNQFEEMKFVCEVSRESRHLYVDAALIPSLPQDLNVDTRVTVILWDGFQSYLQYKSSIDELERRVEEVRVRAIGDPSEWNERSCDSNKLTLLFPQQEQLYCGDMLRRERLDMFAFASPVAKLELTHRSKLISGKVAMQLILEERRKDYKRTKHVFCGQSGIKTLHHYRKWYGLDLDLSAYPDGGLQCDNALVLSWISSILRNRAHWSSNTVARGLLRLMALRALYRRRRDEIFLNVYPARNINAYQAGMLFRRHLFLEFGGIHGSEPIYPRTADIAFHGRKMIRFSSDAAIQEMRRLDDSDVAGIASFADWYAEQVVSSLDRSTAAN